MTTRHLLRRINQLIDDELPPVIIQRMKSEWGMTDFSSIWLEPTGRLLIIFIHECLHLVYPEMCETRVTELQRQMTRELSSRQCAHLMKRLGTLIQ